jgi:hypothetical protein
MNKKGEGKVFTKEGVEGGGMVNGRGHKVRTYI